MYDTAKALEIAKEFYAGYGVDVDQAVKICDETPVSIHCWQGDDTSALKRRRAPSPAAS